MILKRLIAQGFKSFADRTEFDFDRGVTCIVGPNGCGKSNVVDAIKWVLGEQSAKSLRGKQMLDVIFNGSGTRKSSGMAQVDLVFDNSDGTLPTDQTEVVVTRRLFRSGESEYLLNKQSCRLRDIRELFMDTGIGIEAYSVIEQGRVDALLRANPVERRTIFEEAAGISKFKARKREAQRRLERVDQNLLRLQDIVDELEKRLRSIKIAAGKARSFQQYSIRLKELRSRYVLATYHDLRTTQDALDQQVAELSDRSTAIRTRLSESEARMSDAQVRSGTIDREIGETDSRLLTAQSQLTGHEERIASTRQRIAEHTQAVERTRQRIAALDTQIAAVAEQLVEMERRHAAADAEAASHQARVGELQEDERKLSADVIQLQHQLEDEKAGVIDLLRRTASLHNEIQNLTIQHQTLSGQKEKLAARDAEITHHLTHLMTHREQLDSRKNEIEQLLRDQDRVLAETRGRAASVAERQSQLRDQLAAAKEYRSGLQSRRQTLAELDRSREGLIAGARELLARRDADESRRTFDYVLGPIGELFETDVAHAAIIEAVFGELEQYLVVTSRDALLSDRDVLAKIEGRILAVCLDQVPAPISGPDLSGQPGFVACALDWVRVPESCEKLSRYLLGRTFIVESLDDARRLSSEFPGAARFVTLEGVVWEPDGRIALGSLGAGTGLISRRSELRELEGQIAEVGVRVSELGEQITAADDEFVHLERVQHDLRQAIQQAHTERVQNEAALNSVAQETDRLSREQPIVAAEATAVVRQIADAMLRDQQSKLELQTLEQTSDERHSQIEDLQRRIAEMTAHLKTLSESVTQARVAAGEAAQRRTALAESIASIRGAHAKALAESEAARREEGEILERLEIAEQTVLESEAAVDRLRHERDMLTRQAASLREQREQLILEIEERGSEQRQFRGELEAVEAEFHDRRMKLGEVRVRIEDLIARTREELGVELEQQYAGYTPESEDWAAVEAEIEDLKGKIERLGNVNLDAIAEQEELEKRHGFLTGQRDDLRESQRQLVALIEKLDSDSKARFVETFEDVRLHFSELFRKLFGGGKADIMLQDANDVLECGIDIVARPPGKELQNIALMSGGEKTMTAIALVLAVFKSRPSPFTLLDEVDAALDEANNERFNHVIREFLSLSQFIVITHSKRTMNIADVLYGITMQEPGVSKRVAVRLEEHHEVHTAVA